MALAKQKSALPTNKLTSGMFGGLLAGSILARFIAAQWPGVADFTVDGVGDLQTVCQVACGFGIGWLVPDFENERAGK